MQRYGLLILVVCLSVGCQKRDSDMNDAPREIVPNFQPLNLVTSADRVLVSGSIRKGLESATVVGSYSAEAKLERLTELAGDGPRAMQRAGDMIVVGAIGYMNGSSPVSFIHVSADRGQTWRTNEYRGLDLVGMDFRPDAKGFAWSASRAVVVDGERWAEIGRVDSEYKLTKFALHCSDREAVFIASARHDAHEQWIVAIAGDRFDKLARVPGRITSAASSGSGAMLLCVERKGLDGFELMKWDLKNPREISTVSRVASGHAETMVVSNGRVLIAGNEGVPTVPWTSLVWQGALPPEAAGIVELTATRLTVRKSSAIGFADDGALWCFNPDEGLIRVPVQRN